MATYFRAHDLINGFPTAVSGSASFYYPDTTAPVVVYGDTDGTAITNPVTLDSNGAALVYLSQLARMIVQDVDGVIIADTVINGDADTTIANTSAAFTGDTQKDVNDAALAAFGGQNFQYVPSGAWVGMTPKNWMNAFARNVAAYGAVGASTLNDGVTPCDSALAAAIADAQATGGGVVFLGPGTWLLNSPVAINTTGVVIQGAGAGITTLKINSGTNDGLVFTSVNGASVRGLTITATASTTGKAIKVTGGTGFTVDDVTCSSGKVDIGLYLSGVTNVTVAGNCNLGGATDGISATTINNLAVIGGVLNGGTASIATSGCTGVALIGTTAFLATFDASTSGVAVVGGQCSFAGALPIGFFQKACGADGYTITVATGATATAISFLNGFEVMIHANSGGAGTVTVPDPSVLPAATTRGQLITIRYRNGSGGAVTWAFSGTKFVHVGAAVPAATDGHTIAVLYIWDGSKLHEIARGDTVT